MTTPPFALWLSAFAWTLAVETPLYALVLHRALGGAARGVVRAVAASLVVNAATHPALWYVFPYWEPYWAYVLVAELCVAVVEASLLAWLLSRARVSRARAWRIAIVASVLANAASTAVGLLRL